MSEVVVCVPAYRPLMRHLEDLVASVAGSNVGDVSILITEDPSDQPPLSMAALERFGPVRYHRNENRLGMVGNWNHCVSNADCEFALVLGQDDRLTPSGIDRHLALLRAHPDLVLSSSPPQFIDDLGNLRQTNSKAAGGGRLFAAGRTYFIPHETHAKLALHYGNVTGEPCGSMFRRDAWREIAGYSERYAHSADLDFALRLSKVGGTVAYTHESFSQRRLHEANLTHIHIDDGTTSRDRQRLLQDHMPASMSRVDADRARARIITHDVFDALRTRRLDRLPRVRRPVPYRGILRDVAENLGYPPSARREVERCITPVARQDGGSAKC